jgi:hypothetical protein
MHPSARISRMLCLGGMSVMSAGCYALQPAGGVVPVTGTNVAFDINDAGRVALGGSMGAEIAQVAGRLVSRDTSEYLLAVSDVELLRGGNQVWRGEEVRIKTAYVSTVYERRFSVPRTIGLAAVTLVALTALAGKVITSPPNAQPDTNSGSPQSRGRRPQRPIHAPVLRSPNPPRSY